MSRREKGAELEVAFASWMESNLGYTSTNRNVLINGKASKRPYEVDVHGEIYSRFWRVLHVGGIAMLLLAIATAIWPRDLVEVHRAVEISVSSIVPEATGWGLAMVSMMAFVIGFIGKRKASTHAWVECKNRQGSVKRADMEKLKGAVHDVNENPRADWKPRRVIMVSGSRFDVDALGIARTHGIDCYERAGDGFQRVT